MNAIYLNALPPPAHYHIYVCIFQEEESGAEAEVEAARSIRKEAKRCDNPD